MTRQQIIPYVAIALNAALYGVYILLSHTLTGSRAAKTLTYCSGVWIGFLLNRDITFRFKNGGRSPFPRYIAIYIIGYTINLGILWIFVDKVGIAHELVQGRAILILSVTLFAPQQYWVFSDGGDHRPLHHATPAA